MADLRNKYGDVVYRIEGDRINDIYGNWKYEIRGEYIFDTYGNRTYEVRGEWLYDNSGNRLGEMKNLADILPPPKGSSSSSTSSYRDPNPIEKPSGIWAILAFLFYPFYELRYLKYTANRRDYWRTSVCTYIYWLCAGGIIASSGIKGYIIPILIVLVVSLPIIFVSIRRMHDIGKSGWWNLIPIVGFVMCAFFPGK